MHKPSAIFAIIGLAVLATTAATIAQQTKQDKGSAGSPTDAPATSATTSATSAPAPAMSESEMQAMTDAATPGPMHEWLAADVGTWDGTSRMWMAPGAEPIVGTAHGVTTLMMEGRFIKTETTGNSPGMPPYSGFAITGYDNVAKEFQGSWIDTMGTGMAFGHGTLAADGKTLTWTYTFNCPVKKCEIAFREVTTRTGDNTRLKEFFFGDPATGKEFKMMDLTFERKADGPAAMVSKKS